MLLYHFTSHRHLPLILDAQTLHPTESNIGSPSPAFPPYGLDVGPPVVWLLDTPTIGGFDHGLGGSVVDKTEVRFTVLTKFAVKWTDWVWTSKMHPEWRDGFVKRAGGEEAADHWWILPAPIKAARWEAIHDMKTGKQISQPD